MRRDYSLLRNILPIELWLIIDKHLKKQCEFYKLITKHYYIFYRHGNIYDRYCKIYYTYILEEGVKSFKNVKKIDLYKLKELIIMLIPTEKVTLDIYQYFYFTYGNSYNAFSNDLKFVKIFNRLFPDINNLYICCKIC